jgi:hypothetical protein
MTDRISAPGAAFGAAPNTNPAASSLSTLSHRSPHALSSFWEQYAFSVGEIDFLQVDIALAAMVFGEWAQFERRLAEGLASVARGAAEHVTAPQDAIDEAAIAFRYERDLISGEDVTAWLDRAGISSDEWMASIERHVYRQMWADEIEDTIDRFSPSPRQLGAAAHAEGICSGLFDLFEESLSGKAATVLDLDPARFQSAAHASTEQIDAATRLARQHAHWLGGRSSRDTLARLSLILSIRDAYCALSERVVTEPSLLEIIEANRLEWVAIEMDTLSFVDEGGAREALLCVTEDRLALADVAALSRHPLIRTRCFLTEISPEHRPRLLAAEPGRVIGPLVVDGRFEVTSVIGRTPPTLEDDQVVERARTALLEQAARRAARSHVTRKRLA